MSNVTGEWREVDLEELTFDTIEYDKETEGFGKTAGYRWRTGEYIATGRDGVERYFRVVVRSDGQVKIKPMQKTPKQTMFEDAAIESNLSDETQKVIAVLRWYDLNAPQKQILDDLVMGRKPSVSSVRAVMSGRRVRDIQEAIGVSGVGFESLKAIRDALREVVERGVSKP